MADAQTPPPARKPSVVLGRTRRIKSSATRIQLGDKRLARIQAGKRQDWQPEAWEYFDDVGIVKQTLMFRANLMSRVRLFPAVRPLDDPEGAPIPVSDPQSGIPPAVAAQAQAEIQRIRGRSGGTAEVLRLLDLNTEVCGECFIVGVAPREELIDDIENPGGKVLVLHLESWSVRSVLEVEISGEGKYKVKDEDDKTIELDERKGDVCVRIWQRHPGHAHRADCHMRAVLTDCESLVLLTNEVKAESKSRQGNGILAIPNTMSVTTPSRTEPPLVDDDDEALDDDDEFDDDPDVEDEPAAATIGEVLEEAIMEPIADPGSAWSVWPVIVIGPAEDIDKIKHIQLHRESSAVLEDRIVARKEAIAQGLNMPIEVAKGHANTTFSNAEQIDADILEKHIDPSCVMVVDMWTVGLLQPALIDSGIAPEYAERIIVWYDASSIKREHDPADSADKGVELDAISDEAWRRYKGFSEDDAPPPIDKLIRAILKQRSWDPGLVDAVVKALDPGLEVPAPVQGGPTPQASASIDGDLLAALGRLRDEGPESSSRGKVLTALLALRDASAALRASATPDTTEAGSGARLAAGDKELATKTLAMLNAAMTRQLERAGSRLKARQGPTHETLRTVNPLYAGRMLGPSLVHELGVDESTLFDDAGFDPTVETFTTWAKHWQGRALKIAAALAGFSSSKVAHLEGLQQQHLADSAEWMRDNLHELATDRLYSPDPLAPERGEYDPSSRVPPGFVRMALAIAGGAVGLEVAKTRTADSYVMVNTDGTPPGGIGTGVLLHSAIIDEGSIVVEGWQWDYGDSYRKNPFEGHESLDGQVMESAVDFTVDAEDAFVGDHYFPGDHDGCACGDLIPVYAQAPTEVTGGDAGTGLDDPERGANLFGNE